MPIYHKGISTGRARGRVGKIRLGEKEVGATGQEHPKALPWFRFDPEDPTMLPTLHNIFGPKPKLLRILLTNNDRELVFPHYLKRYGTSKKTGRAVMICKGTGELDGETGEPLPALQRLDLSSGEVIDDFPCNPNTCPDFLAEKCSYVGSLSYLLWDFPTLRPWQTDTGSEISIRRLNTRLDDLAGIEFFGGKGNIAGVPLVLSLGPVQVKRPEWRAPRTVYCMDLELDTALMLDPQWREKAHLLGAHVGALEAPDETEHPEGLFSRSEVLGVDVAEERRELAAREDVDDAETVDKEPSESADPAQALGAPSDVLPKPAFRAKLEEVYFGLEKTTQDAAEAMRILNLDEHQGLAMIYSHIDAAGRFQRLAMVRSLIALIDRKNGGEDISGELEELRAMKLPGDAREGPEKAAPRAEKPETIPDDNNPLGV